MNYRLDFAVRTSFGRFVSLALFALSALSAFAQAPTITAITPSTGPVGRAVRIDASALSSAPLIRFNGVQAQLLQWGTTPGWVFTFVPTGATSGKVTLETSSGTATSTADFTVAATPATPANDAFANATTITGTTGTISGTNVGASLETGEPVHCLNADGTPGTTAGGRSIWYRWVAPSTGAFLFTNQGSSEGVGALLGVYTGSSVTGLTRIVASRLAFAGYPVPVTMAAVAGTTYYIAVDGRYGVCGDIVLNWSPVGPPTITSLSTTSGAVGSSVYIYGSNLAGLTAVRFNGVPSISFVAWAGSTTGATAYVPSDATTGPLTVETAAGIATAPTDFTVGTGGAPTITGQPGAPTVNAGQNTTFYVTATGTAPLSYQWKKNGADIVGATTASLALTNVRSADAADYTVVVSNSVGSVTSAVAKLSLIDYTPYAFTTLAGLSPIGSADGTGTAAKFRLPRGIVVDSTGNTYVADTGNNTIRKITATGIVTTLAGSVGVSGSADGTGSAAQFRSPEGLALDSTGNLYVADTGNNTIRKITSAGVVMTFAGAAGSNGSTDGTGTAARFSNPRRLAFDSAGNLYVADNGNNTIRMITPAGAVTTLAGSPGQWGSADGTGSAARFNSPYGLAVDSTGNIYVGDRNNNTIRKITSTGVVTTLAGSAGQMGNVDGAGSVARFSNPTGVVLDSTGNLYVTDTNNRSIRKITSVGLVSTLAGHMAGDFVDGTGSAAQFNNPEAIAIDSTANLYVADTYSSLIRKVTSVGVVSTVAGFSSSWGASDGAGSVARFHQPSQLALDSAGNLYVADARNFVIRKITPAGVASTLAGLAGVTGSVDGTGSDARFDDIRGIAVDNTGNVFVADTGAKVVRKITPTGVASTLAGLAYSSGSADGTGSAARFNDPHSVGVDGAGNVYVVDSNTNNTIRKITPTGVVTTLAGSVGQMGSADGMGSAARFNGPWGLTADSAGNVYVADSGNNTIRKITPAGDVSTVAGMANTSGPSDGIGTAARFSFPCGVALDSTGNIYVAENNLVRKISPSGVVTTLAGTRTTTGCTDGIGANALFSTSWGIAVNGAGTLYVADTLNNTIRQGAVAVAPAIGTQPVAQTATIGQTVNFTVTATGDFLSYQWSKNGVAIPGATSNTLTLTNVQPADVASYTVVVSNSLNSVASTAATLSGAGLAPTISTQPVNVSATVGQPAALTVAATGSGSLAYQWRRNGFAISGATGTTYSIPTAQQSDADSYDVIVTDGLLNTVSNSARLGVAPTAYPAALKLDPAFNLSVENDGAGTLNAVVPYHNPTTGLDQFIVGGDFIRVAGNTAIRRLARFNADGTLDASFAPNLNYTVNAVLVQPDGQIVVGGSFVLVNGVVRNRLVRLNPDGSVDFSFNPGSGPSSTVYAIVRQPADGKLIIGGNFNQYNGSTANRIARLNADGTLDTTFLIGGSQGVTNTVNALALDPATGKVVLGGSFTTHSNGASLNRIARFNTDGTNDTTFALGTGFDNTVNALAFDGTTTGATASAVLVGGSFTSYNGSAANVANRLVRLTSLAALDSTFVTGTGFNGTVYALAYDSANSRWLLGGSFTSYNGSTTSYNRLIRLSAGGVLDTAFNPNVNNTVNSIFIQPADGAVVFGGSFGTVGGSLVRLLSRVSSSGALDGTVNVRFRAAGTVNRILPLPGGKLLVAGNFTHFGNTATMYLARLNSDLTIDQTFTPAGGNGYTSAPTVTLSAPTSGTTATATATIDPTNGRVNGFTLTSAGTGYTVAPTVTLSGGGGTGATATATLISGVVTAINLNSSAAGPSSPVLAAALQGDGKIMIGGNFYFYNGTTANRVARLNADLSLDTTFSVGTGPDNWVYALALMPGGGVYVGGTFANVAGTARAGVARLSATGALDTAFNAGSTTFTVYALGLQADGKLIAGGSFTNTVVNGSTRNNIVRFNTDGTLDNAFPVLGANSTVRTILIQPDKQILIGGDFSSYNGTTIYDLARLNATDGSLDSTFTIGTTLNSPVDTIVRQEDANLLLFGNFGTTVAGAPITSWVGRVRSDGSFDTSVSLWAPNYGSQSFSQPNGLQILPDGSVLVGTVGMTLSNQERTGLIHLIPSATPTVASISAAAAVRPGASLTITGSNFYDVTAVRFGGVNGTAATSFTVNSPTQITVTVPLGAVSGPVAVQSLYGTASTASALTVAPDFQLRNPSTTASSFESGVAYGNNAYVAVALSGSIWSSPDGIAWTQRFSGPNGLNGIAFAAGQFVVVGNSGVLLTSTDGATWTQRVVFTTSTLSGVVHNGTKWLVVSGDSNVLTSTDAVAWTVVSSSGGGSATGVAFGAGVFVSVADIGVIRTSPDGLTWTSRTSGTTNKFKGIFFANGLFVAIGNSGTLVTSSDGSVWTSRSSGTSSTLYKGAYGASRFVVGGGTTMVTSVDGATWTAATGVIDIRSVVFGGGQFVGAGWPGSIATSPDASSSSAWTRRSASSANNLRDVAYGNGRFVTVSTDTSSIYRTSADGVNWTLGQNAAGTSYALNGVAYGNGLFVAVGANGILSTTNGTTWTNNSPTGTYTLNGVAYGLVGGSPTYVAVGNSGAVYRSNDGVAWSSVTSGTTNALNSVAYGAGVFTAVGASGTVLTSSDGGATWTIGTSGTTNALNSVRFINGQFIAVGASSTVLTSPAGATWTPRTVDTTGVTLTGVAYGDGYYIAVPSNYGTSFWISADAVTWTKAVLSADVFSFGSTQGLIYANGRFVIVGSQGWIASSNPAPDTLVVTAQPADSLVAPGGTATLAVTAAGTGLSYQWYSGLSGDTSSPVSGAVSASYTTPPLTAPARYWVRVTGATGSVDSAAATVGSTSAAPVITTQPVGAKITSGQPASFSVTATGTGTLSYQWQRDGAAIPGATAAGLSIPAATRIDAGYYNVVVSDSWGKSTVSATALLQVAPTIYPQGVRVDPTPASNHLFERNGATINRILVQSDGKVVVAGDFSQINGTPRMRLVRLDASGNLDPGFAPPAFNSGVSSLAQQPGDQKLLVGGSFVAVGGSAQINRLVRLNTDGTLDTSFNTVGSGPNSTVNAIVALPGGKILIGGSFGTYNGISVSGIARLNADGSLDASFNATSAGSSVNALAVQPADGGILLGGGFTSVNGVSRNRMARLNADGSLDYGFNPGSGASSTVRAIAVQPGGKIVIGGDFTSYNGIASYLISTVTHTVNRLARLNSDGSLDQTFAMGSAASSTVYDIAMQTDATGVTLQGILVAGNFSNFAGASPTRPYLVRLTAAGAIDATFVTSGGPTSQVNSVALQKDTSGAATAILVGGNFGTVASVSRAAGLARLGMTGALDTTVTFNPSALREGYVYGLAPLAGGKTLVAGDFVQVDGVAKTYLARIAADGSIETGFTPVLNAYVYAARSQADGRIVIAGSFTSLNGQTINRLARLNADGSTDTTFNVGSGVSGAYTTIVPQPDGKLLLCGNVLSATYAGVNVGAIMRVNPDGSLDTAFNPGAFAASVNAAVVLPDGKILIASAAFNDYLNFLGGYVARLNGTDGSLDTSFNPGTGQVTSIRVTNGGAGYTSAPTVMIAAPALAAGVPATATATLTGGVVTAVTVTNPGSGYLLTPTVTLSGGGATTTATAMPTVSLLGFNNTINALAVNSDDGSILVGGAFTSYTTGATTTTRNYVARLTSTGALDPSFDPGTGPNSAVYRLVLQEDGRVLLRGGFASVSSTPNTAAVARLNANGTVDSTLAFYGVPSIWLTSTYTPLVLADDGSIFTGGYNYFVAENQERTGLLHLVGATAPSIVLQPQNIAATAGRPTVDFTVVAAGSTPLSYQWMKDGVLLAGATNPTLTLPNVQLADVGAYSVTVSNVVGAISSSAAILSGVNPVPTITTQPVAFASGTTGGSVTLTVAASGTGLTYQWRKYGVPIAGATGTSLSLSNLAGAQNGLYDVVIANGLSAVASRATRLEVGPATYPNALKLRASFAPRIEGPGTVNALAVLGDGRYYATGSFTSVEGSPRLAVARFLVNGSLDPAFAPVPITATIATVYAMAVQSNNRVVLGGSFNYVGGAWRPNLVRLNADGTVDAGFDPGAGVNSTVTALAVQPVDSKIIVGGSFTTFNGIPCSRLLRLNSDGTLDPTFNVGAGFDGSVTSVAIQSDNKILVGGSFTSYNGTVCSRLVRLNSDGSPDTAFVANTGAGFSGAVNSILIQPDNLILVGGSFTAFNGQGRNYLTRLKADGTLDPAFAQTGNGLNNTVYSLAVQAADGKIVAVGQFTGYDTTALSRIVRLTSAGALDGTFNSGAGFPSTVNAVAVRTSDGLIVAGGAFATYNNAPRHGLARLNGDGSLDAAAPSLRAPATVWTVVPVSGGKWLIGGSFTYVNDIPCNFIARLNSDGFTDTSFVSGSGFNNSVEALIVQGDGKILAGGTFINYNGVSAVRIARLGADGALDSGFTANIGTGFDQEVASLVLQPNGRIVVSGRFTTVNGNSRIRIARLTSDGAFDSSFNPGTGLNDEASRMIVQPDGKIIAGGYFSTFNGTSVNRLVRLTADGAFDSTPGPAALGSRSIFGLALQPDGKILAGGSETNASGTSAGVLERYNADWSEDLTFATGSGFASTVGGLVLQADGKIVVLGGNTYNGDRVSGLSRLNSNGTLDTSYGAPMIGWALSTPSALALADDGSLLTGFPQVNLGDRICSGLAVWEAAPSPAILAPPYAATVQAGQNVTFSVTAVGTGKLCYQWQRNGVALTENAQKFWGVATNILAIYDAQAADVGDYTVVVSDDVTSITSVAAKLVVQASPATLGTGMAQINIPVAQASSVVYATASGFGSAPLTAQWQKNGVNVPGGAPAFQPGSFDYLFNGVKSSDAGDYALTLTNGLGTATSNSARLLVDQESNWQWQAPLPTSNTLYTVFALNSSLAPGNGQYFLLTGGRGFRAVSLDGTGWQQLPSLSVNSGFTAYAYGNGVHVAGGNSAYVATSRDGANWTPAYIGGSTVREVANEIVFGNGVFVAVCSSGHAFTSPDGQTWTQRATGTNEYLFEATYGNGFFLVSSSHGRLFRSPDGITWTQQATSPTDNVFILRYFNGVFFLGTTRGELFTSTDGLTWTPRPTGVASRLYAMNYAAGQYVIVGFEGTVLTSADGLSWTQRPSGVSDDLYGVAYANGTWVAASGSSNTILTSTDGGATWTNRTTSVTSQNLTALAANGNASVVVAGASGTILRSTTGDYTWMGQNSGTSNQFNDVAYGGGAYVAVGNSGTVRRSTDDGVSWGGVSGVPTTNPYLYCVGFLNGQFVATGASGTILTSSNGSSWTSRTSGTGNQLNGAAYGRVGGTTDTYVAVGVGGTILTSPDSIAWTTRPSGTVASLNRVAFANGLFMAVGSSGTILTSPDGVAWTARGFNPNLSYNHVSVVTAGSNSLFVVSGYAGGLFVSADGVNWSGRFTGVTSTNFSETAVFNGRLYGVGNNGTIASASLAPQVGIQPQAQAAMLGGSTTFTVLGAGTPFPVSYQWRKNGVVIAGATDPTYTATNVQPADSANTYDVVLTNGAGSVTSATATVNQAPVIIDQPVSQQGALGGQVQFQVSATGASPLSFQWKKDGAGLVGATSTTLTLTNVTSADLGSYTCVVTNSVGSVVSAPAELRFTTITPTTHEVGEGRVVYQVLVQCMGAWSVEENVSWLSVSRASGSLDGNVEITVEPNTTAADRTATITIGGATHTVTQRAAGTALRELWAMGSDDWVQLGDNRLIMHLLPRPLTTEVQAVAAGSSHSYFLKTDGTLWAMGSNANGQLGDGTTINRNVPVQVATDVKVIATGGNQSLFVKTDNTLWAVGRNTNGQLGDGTTVDKSTPVQVATGVKAVAASSSHSLFLKTDGTLWAMGSNSTGQLGDSTTIGKSTPVQVATSVQSVAAGNGYSLFVKTDGSLWAVGNNASGQLGDGTTTNRPSPIQVATGFHAVATGSLHSLFLKSDGTLLAAGQNNYGQLGDGTTTNRSAPIQVATGVQAAAGGTSHSLFVKLDGTLWAMGWNANGELGDGTTTDRSTPVQVATDVTGISAGGYHSLFTTTDGTLWTAGFNYYGQLGDGSVTQRSQPIQSLAGVESVAAGNFHALYLTAGGSLWAMGWNVNGQLGDGTTAMRVMPELVTTGVQSMAAGYTHSLYVKTDGSLWAMGDNAYGQLGDGTTTQRNAPVQILSAGVKAVAAGQNFSLIVKTNGSLWAMGQNSYGQLGDGTTTQRSAPVQILASGVLAAAAGTGHSLILNTDGSLLAMGYNYFGQLGDGTTTNRSTPVPVTGGVQSIAAGINHSLFVKTDGKLWAMGANLNGQLGDGTTTNRSTPVEIAPAVQAVSAGGSHSLILKADHTLWAVGGNRYGQLGDGTTTDRSTPVSMATNVKAVAAGSYYSLFIATGDVGIASATPTIATQPAGQTITAGQTVTLSVTAVGTGLTYQWYRGVSGDTSALIAAATAASYTTLALTASAQYWVRVASSTGATVDSATATLLGPVAILSQPQLQTVGGGGNASFNVTALGSGTLTYQWQKNGVNLVNSVKLTGATSSSLLVSNVQAADAGSYTVIVGNGNGGPATSNAVSLTVAPQAPVFGATIGGTVLVAEGKSFPLFNGYYVATINNVATSIPAITGSEPIAYRWKKNGVEVSNGGTISGADTRSLTFTNVLPTDAGDYTLYVSNTVGNATSGVFTLIVASAARPYTFTTLAGQSNKGGTDGIGTAARFTNPQNMTLVGTTLYIADSLNHVIRKLDTVTGAVTTLAGLAGFPGSVDGTGSAARFNTPSAVAVDGAGNVYVADNYNAVIRKITPGGVVTTLAGLPQVFGCVDGVGSDARFNRMGGMVLDGAGCLYVTDSSYGTIRKIDTATGATTTFVGVAGQRTQVDGTSGDARFVTAAGLTRDSATGNLYMTDSGTSTVRKITTTGVVTTIAGVASIPGSTDGVGGAARFRSPLAIAADGSGNLFVADSGNSTIRKIASDGTVSTLAGTAGSSGSVDGTGAVARFSNPSGIVVDASGNLYVADAGNSTIRLVTPSGVVTTIAGQARPVVFDGTGAGAHFAGPSDVALDSSGNAYVADASSCTIRKITPAGVTTTLAGQTGVAGTANGIGTAAQFNGPLGVAVDASGNVYVADTNNCAIRKIATDGTVTTVAGLPGVSGNVPLGAASSTGTAARFQSPRGIIVDSQGYLYVADITVIRRIAPDGTVINLAGTAGTSGFLDAPAGQALSAQFFNPWKLALDSSGNIWVADRSNNRLRKITPQGAVTTELNLPGLILGLAVDGSDDVYMSMVGSVWKYRPGNAALDLLAGGAAAGALGSADGTGSAALWFETDGLAVNAQGKVYVTDAVGNTISTGVLAATPFIATQPTDQTVAAGGTATLTVSATGVGPFTYQWYRNSAAVDGATTATLTLTSVTIANAGSYTCVVTNSAGSTTSTAVTLAVTLAPTIATQPQGQVVNAGQTVTLSVVVSGTPPPTSYQWRKGTTNLTDGGNLSGAMTATLTIANAQPADTGAYSVLVGNGVTSLPSDAAAVTVIPAGTSATHAVLGNGYVAGGTVTISNTLTYSGTAASLGWHVLLPAGWSFAGSGGSAGDTKPAVGATEVLDWAWTTIPASPVTFTYTLNAPAGTTGDREIVATAIVRQGGPVIQFMVNPDPLIVGPATYHDSDTDHNWRLSLLELTRVIELYNTRNGTVRTGCYAVATTATEDGFAQDAARANSATVTLTRYYSADTDKDGKIGLVELTRVIELYNTRAGTTRTGQYHAQAGTEDGFAPGSNP